MLSLSPCAGEFGLSNSTAKRPTGCGSGRSRHRECRVIGARRSDVAAAACFAVFLHRGGGAEDRRFYLGLSSEGLAAQAKLGVLRIQSEVDDLPTGSLNPIGAALMKQGGQIAEGANRRTAEKAEGWKVLGVVTPGEPDFSNESARGATFEYRVTKSASLRQH